jgi:hypothetical protein
MFDPDYIITRQNVYEWTITKWTRGKAPVAIYRVVYDKGQKRLKCSCPSAVARGRCKHVEMVRRHESYGGRYGK